MRPGTWAPAGGDIGTESQGKVWIRRPQPNPTQPRSNQVPRAPAGCRGDGRGGDAVIGPCSPSPPPPPGGLSPTVSARRPAGPGAGRHRRRGGWTGSRNGPDLRRAQTGGVRGCQGGTGGCWHTACSDGRAALGATAGAAHGAPSLASCLSPLLEGRWGPSAGGRNTPRGAEESPGPCSCSCRLGDPATGGSTQGSSARAQGQLGAVLGGTRYGCRPTATPGVPRWGALWGLHRAPGTAPGCSRGTQLAWGQPDPTAAWSPPVPSPPCHRAHQGAACGDTRLPATLCPAGHAVPLGHRAVPAPRPQAVPTSKVSPVIPRMGKCHPATMSCHPSGAELGTPLGARCHFASPGPPGRREPAARGSQSQVTKVSLLAGWGWGRALTCPMHPRVAVGRGWPLGTAVVGDGDKETATRSGHRGHSSRALGHCPGTLPPSWGHSHLLRDTATFHGALPPSWGHCHFHEDTDLSGNTATFPVMSQPS